jgi:Flp pilus assembly protein TadG
MRRDQALQVAATRLRGDRGAASVEMAGLVYPAAILSVLLLVAVWRIVASDLDVQSAASSAARAASLQRSPEAAVDAARHAAEADLAGNRHTCATLTVATDTTAFARGGSVTVTISCTVATGDLGIFRIVNGPVNSASARASIDTYGAAQP